MNKIAFYRFGRLHTIIYCNSTICPIFLHDYINCGRDFWLSSKIAGEYVLISRD